MTTDSLEKKLSALSPEKRALVLARLRAGKVAGDRGLTLERIPRESAVETSFAQERLWFIEQLDSGTATYHVPFVVRLRGALDVAALEAAVAALVARHEILRTTLTNVDGR